MALKERRIVQKAYCDVPVFPIVRIGMFVISKEPILFWKFEVSFGQCKGL